MAKNKKSSDIVSTLLARTIKEVFNDLIEKGDMVACVSAATMVEDKRIAKLLTVNHPKTLETLVKAAVAGGQVSGLGIRKGFAGGIHRVAVVKAKKAKTAPVTEAVAAEPVAAAA